MEDLLQRYRAGESENSLAKHLGISRGPMRRLLLKHGAVIRSNADANRLLAASRTPEQRLAYTRAAHDAVRGTKQSTEVLIARARSREDSRVSEGKWERELLEELIRRGHVIRAQQAVHTYNLDLGMWPLAVEVHSTTRYPHGVPRLVERMEYLFNHGWSSIYVMAYRGLNVTRVADQIEALFKQAKRNPASISEYRVIRGSGDLLPLGFHLN